MRLLSMSIIGIGVLSLCQTAAAQNVASHTAASLEESAGQDITWWVVGSGGVLDAYGTLSEEGEPEERLSGTAGQTGLGVGGYDAAEPALYDGFWLPERSLLATTSAPETSEMENSSISNYPNPFSSTTTVTYHVDAPGRIRLVIHDLKGGRIRILADAPHEPGEYSVSWDGKGESGEDVASGYYICSLDQESSASPAVPQRRIMQIFR